MKDHIEERRPIDLYGSPGDVIAHIRQAAEGLIEPEITLISWNNDRYSRGSWDNDQYGVVGWRPMTDAELARQERKRQSALVAAAKRKERAREAERKTYERLKTKFEKEAQ